MKLITKEGLRNIFKLLNQKLMKKDEILLTGPKVISMKSDNGIVNIENLDTNTYIHIEDDIHTLNINNINPIYNHKETYSYIQFSIGDEKPSISINDNVLWYDTPTLDIESKNYRLEFCCANGVYFVKLNKYK